MRVIAAIVFLGMIFPAYAATREQETAACQDDANRLCSEYIPDEDAIAACMRQHLQKLTPACRAMFKPVAKRHHRDGNQF